VAKYSRGLPINPYLYVKKEIQTIMSLYIGLTVSSTKSWWHCGFVKLPSLKYI